MTAPPDLKQCESMITPAYSAFNLGRPSAQRCPEKPTHLAAFPFQGTMSICGDCLPELNKQMAGQFNLKPIGKKARKPVTIEATKGGT